MDYKNVLGTIAVLIAIAGYVPYIRDILRHKTHPHAYTWLTWSILSVINFGIQVTNNAGAGAWAWFICAVATMSIFVLSLFYGKRDIKRVDTYGLMGATVAFILWVAIDRPLASVFLISIVEVFGGFFPTFRKSYLHPEKETISIYVLSAIYMSLAVMAQDEISLVNTFYPAVCIVMSSSMACFLKVRRIQMRTSEGITS